jgi:hypothetical protein
VPGPRAKKFLWVAGIAGVICAAALVSAVVLWSTPAEQCYAAPNVPCTSSDPELTRKDEFELEKIGGKSMVLAVEFNHWLASWFHGVRLALLIFGVSLVVAATCYAEARWLMAGEDEKT